MSISLVYFSLLRSRTFSYRLSLRVFFGDRNFFVTVAMGATSIAFASLHITYEGYSFFSELRSCFMRHNTCVGDLNSERLRYVYCYLNFTIGYGISRLIFSHIVYHLTSKELLL